MAEAGSDKRATPGSGSADPAISRGFPTLKLSGVHAGYGETVVLEDVEFSLPERGSLAVLGRNGVGKTTLLATVMGLTTFHSGSIDYQGRPIAHLPVYERSRLGIGYVPQAREIFPSLSVEENLAIAARPGRWTLKRVYDLFPGVAKRRSHKGDQISGGEQQMLAIGRALMGNPSLLLMDEPLEGLAPIIVEALLKALARLIQEESLTVVLVEQHAKLALEVTQDALVLNRGRISYLGTSAELLADPQRLTSLIVNA
jgi:branched-chain amino acid transport system ATP-binding protein